MPRYYFHVRDGKDMRDRMGSELPDVDAARNEAISASSEMLRSLRESDVLEWRRLDHVRHG
jgi:hypothetical protein